MRSAGRAAGLARYAAACDIDCERNMARWLKSGLMEVGKASVGTVVLPRQHSPGSNKSHCAGRQPSCRSRQDACISGAVKCAAGLLRPKLDPSGRRVRRTGRV